MTEQLMKFTINGNLEKVKKLINDGVDVNYQDKYDGWSALMVASWNGYFEIVKLLVENGANLNLQNGYGETALDIARNGQTALIARKIDFQKIVELLTANK